MKRITHILFPQTRVVGCLGIAYTLFIITRELQILKNEASLKNPNGWIINDFRILSMLLSGLPENRQPQNIPFCRFRICIPI
jgi:hypothetical protein